MNRQFKKGALLRWGALALLMSIAIAQTPTTRKPYIYWWAPGDALYDWKPLIVEPPLKVTVDAAGQFHLSIPASATQGGFAGAVTKTSSYAVTAADCGKWLVFDGDKLTATLPPTPPPSTCDWTFLNVSSNATPLTITGAGNPINHAGNIVLQLGQSAKIGTDGITNYWALSVPVDCGWGMMCKFYGNHSTVEIGPVMTPAN